MSEKKRLKGELEKQKYSRDRLSKSGGSGSPKMKQRMHLRMSPKYSKLFKSGGRHHKRKDNVSKLSNSDEEEMENKALHTLKQISVQEQDIQQNYYAESASQSDNSLSAWTTAQDNTPPIIGFTLNKTNNVQPSQFSNNNYQQSNSSLNHNSFNQKCFPPPNCPPNPPRIQTAMSANPQIRGKKEGKTHNSKGLIAFGMNISAITPGNKPLKPKSNYDFIKSRVYDSITSNPKGPSARKDVKNRPSTAMAVCSKTDTPLRNNFFKDDENKSLNAKAQNENEDDAEEIGSEIGKEKPKENENRNEKENKKEADEVEIEKEKRDKIFTRKAVSRGPSRERERKGSYYGRKLKLNQNVTSKSNTQDEGIISDIMIDETNQVLNSYLNAMSHQLQESVNLNSSTEYGISQRVNGHALNASFKGRIMSGSCRNKEKKIHWSSTRRFNSQVGVENRTRSSQQQPFNPNLRIKLNQYSYTRKGKSSHSSLNKEGSNSTLKEKSSTAVFQTDYSGDFSSKDQRKKYGSVKSTLPELLKEFASDPKAKPKTGKEKRSKSALKIPVQNLTPNCPSANNSKLSSAVNTNTNTPSNKDIEKKIISETGEQRPSISNKTSQGPPNAMKGNKGENNVTINIINPIFNITIQKPPSTEMVGSKVASKNKNVKTKRKELNLEWSSIAANTSVKPFTLSRQSKPTTPSTLSRRSSLSNAIYPTKKLSFTKNPRPPLDSRLPNTQKPTQPTQPTQAPQGIEGIAAAPEVEKTDCRNTHPGGSSTLITQSIPLECETSSTQTTTNTHSQTHIQTPIPNNLPSNTSQTQPQTQQTQTQTQAQAQAQAQEKGQIVHRKTHTYKQPDQIRINKRSNSTFNNRHPLHTKHRTSSLLYNNNHYNISPVFHSTPFAYVKNTHYSQFKPSLKYDQMACPTKIHSFTSNPSGHPNPSDFASINALNASHVVHFDKNLVSKLGVGESKRNTRIKAFKELLKSVLSPRKIAKISDNAAALSSDLRTFYEDTFKSLSPCSRICDSKIKNETENIQDFHNFNVAIPGVNSISQVSSPKTTIDKKEKEVKTKYFPAKKRNSGVSSNGKKEMGVSANLEEEPDQWKVMNIKGRKPPRPNPSLNIVKLAFHSESEPKK